MAQASQEDLSRVLHHLRISLDQQFRTSRWPEMTRTLEVLAKVGESQGQRELCLRAQSLRELMGARRCGAGPRVGQLFNDLVFHLSHLQWLAQSSSLARMAASPDPDTEALAGLVQERNEFVSGPGMI